MSRKSKIRWRESDLAELQRTVRNYNAKIARAAKKNPDNIEHLPQKMTMKQAKAAIETRADFNRLASSLQRFSKRGAEKIVTSSRGAKATQWEVSEFKNKQRIENARRTRERKAIEAKEVKIGGKKQGVTRAEMGRVKENALKPSRKKFDSMSQKEWELATKNMDRAFSGIEREKGRVRMRENYIKGLADSGILDAHPEIEEMIRSVDFDTFLETVETDETATFLFYKDPTAFEVRCDEILAAWTAASKGAKK